jgi:hypothetical protein
VSEKVKGILAGSAGLVLVLAAIFFGAGYLISDQKGLPVPTTIPGNRCWLTTKGIDVLDCRYSEYDGNFFVRWKGRWRRVSRCQEQGAVRVLRCRLPYPLRIDLTGDYPKVTAG